MAIEQSTTDAPPRAGVGDACAPRRSGGQIPAETEATVVRIRILPGSQIKADTILVEMINPQTE